MTDRPPIRSPQGSSALIDTAEEVVRGIGRVGYGLLSLGLSLLPKQSREHMNNAVRELSYAFASLPRDFADVAGAEVERWAAGSTGPAPRVQHITVTDESTMTTQTVAVTPVPTPAPVKAAPAPAPTQAVAAMPPTPAPVKATPAPAPTQAVAATPPTPAPVKAAPAPTPTPAAAPTPPAPAPTQAAATRITIAHIEYNPPGRNHDGEYVLLRNSTAQPIDMTGWKLSDGGARHSFTFPNFRLAPGAEVKLWTRAGTPNASNLYWANRNAIWNNNGDTATLKDAKGGLVCSYSYQGQGKK